MAKKDTLKASLVKKKPPVITETKAEEVVNAIHEKEADKTNEDDEAKKVVKTSVDFREALYTDMKIHLIKAKKSMREYLESLVEADLYK